ncbi:hypothetical protein GALMADRAFT_1208159 [Galerina marginata CBS 339.88]|uniref:Condensin complex subunit 1 C-terminal domain-containing protein n=1 Tax=Galerina marginata (strain CBS 339.88) TaxID=685588 RepID=A0A067SHH7_GALM3|nr:hypothetical protein GALMADRAFT_1208159 [Galerina marginata CBS 339.88]
MAGPADELKKTAEFRDSIGNGLPQIITLLSDSSPSVRNLKAAADSVAQLSEQADFDGLFRLSIPHIIALLNDKDEEVRHAASRSLVRCRNMPNFLNPSGMPGPQIVELLRTVINTLVRRVQV